MAGKDDDGQIGTPGNNIVNKNWIQVLTDVVAVSGSEYHSLALKQDGKLFATGKNNYGQLGTGDNEDKNIWTLSLTDVVAIAVGYFHSMAIRCDGSLWATGKNSFGQLGTEDIADRNEWVKVAENVKKVAAGWAHSFVIKQDDSLYAVGNNYYGQLGTNDDSNRLNWTLVNNNITDIGCGDEHSLLIKNNGSLSVTGLNNEGQLGTGNYNNVNIWTEINLPEITPTFTNTATITLTFTYTSTPTTVLTQIPVFTPDSSIILWDRMEDNSIYVGTCTKEAIGSVTFTASLNSKMGNCALFNPLNNYFKYNGIGTTSGTVEFWIKTNITNTGIMWGQWENAYSPPAMGYVMGISLDELRKIKFHVWGYGSDSNTCPSPGNNSVPENDWVYIAVTYNPGAKIYINGQLDYEINGLCTPEWSPSYYLYLPPWGITSGEMYIDELIISNAVRTDADIAQRYYEWTH